jgi:hypothetical protein
MDTSAMLKIDLPEHTGSEPTPQFATDAEVAFAERLRHKLEERYLRGSDASSDLIGEAAEVH